MESIMNHALAHLEETGHTNVCLVKILDSATGKTTPSHILFNHWIDSKVVTLRADLVKDNKFRISLKDKILIKSADIEEVPAKLAKLRIRIQEDMEHKPTHITLKK